MALDKETIAKMYEEITGHNIETDPSLYDFAQAIYALVVQEERNRLTPIYMEGVEYAGYYMCTEEEYLEVDPYYRLKLYELK